MKKNLVICDEDLRYATRLGENISAREDGSLNVYVYSNLGQALQSTKHRENNIFLVSEGFSVEERRSIEAHNIYVLVKGEVWEGNEQERPIRKYQNASEIMREIFSSYNEEEQRAYTQILSGKAKLIAVYSPIHRVGKSTFAKTLARAYAKDKKTLYLNLEEYASCGEEGAGLGEILYYMKQGNRNLRMRLEAAVREKDGYAYLLPVEMAEDLKEISAVEWQAFFHEIIEVAGYERIILDIGECIQGLFDILELCDCIYMPVLRDEISERKLQRFDNNVNKMKLKKLQQKMHRFVMPENVEEFAYKRRKEDD